MRNIARAIAGWILPALIAALMLLILCNPQAAIAGALSGLLLWARNVLPALLPYFILSQLLIESGAVHALGRKLTPLMRAVFRLPGDAGPALLLSWLSGSPSGARIVGQLHAQGALDDDQAARLCASAAMTGPLFLAGSVGGMLGDERAGSLLLVSCLFAALINGIVWRGFGHYGNTRPAAHVTVKNPLSALPGALRDGAIAMIAVGAGITLFSVILSLFDEIGIINVLTAPLPSPAEDIARAAIAGFLELTNGSRAAASLSLPLAQRTAIIAGIAGFGGLSVAAQASVFLSGKVRMGAYLLQRLTQAALSVLSAFALHPLFLPEIAASTSRGGGARWCALCLVVFLLAVLMVSFVLRLIYHPVRRPRPPASAPLCPPAPPCPPGQRPVYRTRVAYHAGMPPAKAPRSNTNKPVYPVSVSRPPR